MAVEDRFVLGFRAAVVVPWADYVEGGDADVLDCREVGVGLAADGWEGVRRGEREGEGEGQDGEEGMYHFGCGAGKFVVVVG